MENDSVRLLPFIGGRHVEVAEFTDLVEPYAGRVFAQIGNADAGTVSDAVSIAASARREMAAMPVHQRARLLRAAADLVQSRAA
ncbi:MAG TPA: aldehyde dehydrogenase family protein, partial [Trebonia sp.]